MIVKKTIDRLTRRKFVTFDDTSLPRVLNTVDLTALGIGSTVGVGFYVLAGEVAKNTAGPAVTISFLIAAVASVFAGLCYAEFGARVPKAGSAYIYSYVCVGEFVAFVIGWNLILEYVIGTASVARGYSGYVDKLANNSMSEALGESMPISVSFLSEYPDFLAFGLSFILSVVLAVGVKESSMMNNIFTFINLVVIAYVIIAAGTQAEGKNWAIPAADVEATCKNPNSTCVNVADDDEKDYGYGGFAPYGFKGIMQGAATCFFGFVGFDCIATTGEEAINPERSIPMSIGLSLLFVFIAYFGMSAVTTLALPYCWQDENAPLVQLFECLDMNTAKWIVSIGALFGFSASLFGAMFPLPRVIYAMADDGLLFRFLSKVNKKFKTPAIATVLSGLFAGIMAMIFNLDALVDMMSIGTLLAYSIVAVCVMLLRYTDLEITNWNSEYTLLKSTYAEDEDGDAQGLSEAGGRTKPGLSNSKYSASDYFQQLFNIKGLKEPTDLTASLASYATLVFCILSSVLGILLVVLQEAIAAGDVGAIVGISISSVLVIVNVVVIARQPESKKKLTFKVPLVPWIPALSAFINLYLMFNLSPATWIRFSVWMALGFLIYFLYGLWNSTEELKSKGKWKGVDNPGFVNDERNNSRLQVIPTIEIQPATPCSSEPNTPSTVHKTPRAKTPLPESPLVTAERQTTSAEVHRKETESVSENEIKEVLASLDRIVSGSEKKRIDSETNASILEDDQELHSSSPKRLSNSDIQARELPPLPDTGAEEDGSSSENEEETGKESKSRKEEGSSLSTDPGYESLPQVMADKEQIANGESEDKASQDPGYQTIEDVKAEVEKAEKERSIHGEEEKPEMEEKPTEQSISVEPVYSIVDKKAKKKPEPFELQTDPKEDSTDNESSLKVSASAPVLPLSSPPPVPPPFPQAGKGLSTSSVPSTPVIRKHPFKVLKRMSSFDDIPPSSPDSPLARHLNKFIIIPVHEPDSDSDASAQASPRESLQDPLMKELTARFKAKEGDNSPEIDKDDKKLFYVGSDDSLESAMAGTDSNSFVANLPSPTITAQTREFKRVLTKDSMLDGLDTIRERGESKIFASEEDKPKENISEKSQDLHSLPESQHESKKDTPKNDETDSPPDDLAKEESSNSLPVSGEEPVKPSFFVGQQEEEGISETERISDAQNEKQSAAEQVVSSSDSESEKQPEVETPVHETNPETESAPEPKRAVQRSQSKNEEFNRLKSMFDK